MYHVQRVPALHGFWDLEKTVLHEICVSGTVGGALIAQKSPPCTYIREHSHMTSDVFGAFLTYVLTLIR